MMMMMMKHQAKTEKNRPERKCDLNDDCGNTRDADHDVTMQNTRPIRMKLPHLC